MGEIVTQYSRHREGINKYIEARHSRRQLFREYREKWDSNEDSLLFLLLETTSRCNLTCPMCIHSVGYDHVPPMDHKMFDLALKNIEEMRIPSVSVNTTNEPLLDKGIFERIHLLSQLAHVVDIFMNTNAVLLTRQHASQLLESELTRLLIGFDAFVPETYERIRVGAGYQDVLDNILTFLELKAKLGKVFPIVRVSLVRISQNEDQIGEWFEFWKNKVDQVCVQEYLTPVLDHSKDDLIPTRTGKRLRFEYSQITCGQPFERAVVRGNGDVLPCCAHFGTKMPIGNITQDSLRDIWYGSRAQELREMFRRNTWNTHPICSGCLRISSGIAANSISG